MNNAEKRQYALTGQCKGRKAMSKSMADYEMKQYEGLVKELTQQGDYANLGKLIKNNKMQVINDITDIRSRVLEIINEALDSEDPERKDGMAKSCMRYLFQSASTIKAKPVGFIMDLRGKNLTPEEGKFVESPSETPQIDEVDTKPFRFLTGHRTS